MNNDLKNLFDEYAGAYRQVDECLLEGEDCNICVEDKERMEEIIKEVKSYILELVEKEVEKMIVNTPEQVMELNKHLPSTLQTQSYNQSVGYVNAVNEVSTIINSLKV